MKIVEGILEKMVESAKQTLSSFHSHRRIARQYAKRFTIAFTKQEQEFILEEILYNQNKSIAKAIANKKNIAIPAIGTFQYRESLEIIKGINKEVKEKYNIERLDQIDPAIKEVVTAELEERKRAILIPLYFKQINKKNSTVNHDFLKGKTNLKTE